MISRFEVISCSAVLQRLGGRISSEAAGKVVGESFVLVQHVVIILILNLEMQGSSMSSEGGGDGRVCLVDDRVVAMLGLSPRGVDGYVDLVAILDAWQSVSDVHALGLPNWEVLTVLGMNVPTVHVPLHDEAAHIVDANSAGFAIVDEVPGFIGCEGADGESCGGECF